MVTVKYTCDVCHKEVNGNEVRHKIVLGRGDWSNDSKFVEDIAVDACQDCYITIRDLITGTSTKKTVVEPKVKVKPNNDGKTYSSKLTKRGTERKNDYHRLSNEEKKNIEELYKMGKPTINIVADTGLSLQTVKYYISKMRRECGIEKGKTEIVPRYNPQKYAPAVKVGPDGFVEFI